MPRPGPQVGSGNKVRSSKAAKTWRGIAAVSVILFALIPATSVAQGKPVGRVLFEAAESARADLNHKPETQRTHADYQKVIEAYRRVYYASPNSKSADAAVAALGELLADRGRVLRDPKSLEYAIGQYRFLIRDYPGSTFRYAAYMAIAQIYQYDLHDVDAARAAYRDFLKAYPNHPLAQDARQALRELDGKAKSNDAVITPAKAPVAPVTTDQEHHSPFVPLKLKPTLTVTADAPADVQDSRAVISRVRCRSKADATRIEVVLDHAVEFETGTVPRPARVYYDLPKTRIADELKRSVWTISDDHVKRVRLAPFRPDVMRLVVELADPDADASATFQENKLVVEVRGRKPKSEETLQAAQTTAAPVEAQAEGEVRRAAKTEVPEATTAASDEPKRNEPEFAKATLQPKSARSKRRKPQDANFLSADDMARFALPLPRAYGAIIPVVASSIRIAYTPELPKQARPRRRTSEFARKSVMTDEPKTANNNSESRTADAAPVVRGREAQPTSAGERSLTRALGLKVGRIVVDAGHGGHDTGTVGPTGLREKDLVLDVALRLGKLLSTRLGADVIYTRDDDTFIPLQERTAIANREGADLFISVHANSSDDPDARGVETYYLNFTRSRRSMEVAARENAAADQSVHELQDLVKKIALTEKVEESREFASNVQRSLYSTLSARSAAEQNRGVKKAPFVVLIGANMPSILAEISFLSNPTDERKLRTPEYRQKIAEALYRGVARYAGGLSGVKVASGAHRQVTP